MKRRGAEALELCAGDAVLPAGLSATGHRARGCLTQRHSLGPAQLHGFRQHKRKQGMQKTNLRKPTCKRWECHTTVKRKKKEKAHNIASVRENTKENVIMYITFLGSTQTFQKES